MDNNSLFDLSRQELRALCDRKAPSVKQMREIKQKVEAVLKEFRDYKETLMYWENLQSKKTQMSN